MGKVLVTGRDQGDPYTVREVGDPTTNTVLYGGPAFFADGPLHFGPMWMSLNVGAWWTPPSLTNRFVVTGSGPDSVATVTLVLDDGSTLDGATYDAGLGWPVRVFYIPVHDDREVVHVDARSSDGTLLYTRDLDSFDGHHPGKGSGGGTVDYSICGLDEPQPQFPTLDC